MSEECAAVRVAYGVTSKIVIKFFGVFLTQGNPIAGAAGRTWPAGQKTP
jgi:hypothetical protein